MSLQVIKIIWILGQGTFLPLVLWLNDLRVSGNFGGAIGVFLLLEAIYVADAFLFLRIFRGNK